MPLAKEEVKFIAVVVDYFTKSMEVEALATIIIASNTRSIWKAIVYQFSISRVFIFDNGQYIDSNYYCDWYDVAGIKVKYCNPRHPYF